MNENKILFITCVNDEVLYQKSLSYIKNLQVPDSIEIEIVAIRNAKSMTSAYNEAMLNSDSKYKIYLHQDVCIQNTNFIFNILDVFKSDLQIGLIGMVGAKIIPVSGIWWEDHLKVGKVYDSHSGAMELLNFNEIKDLYTVVKGIDGLIMITQYDLPWREDIFDGWHFYDLSQSVEFMRKEFKVVVPKQQTAWCIHDCGHVNTANGFDKYRNKFLDNYSKDILPFVSILIPTYNQTCYLKQAIDSALNQSYRNTEIIICDDSTTNDVQDLIKKYMLKSNKIKYINNGGPCGLRGVINMEKCFATSSGEYISYLLHDDLYNLNKIDRMINYFLYDDTLSLITSYRKMINANGDYLGDNFRTICQYPYDIRLTGEEAGRKILFSMINYIGELSTAIFKRNVLNLDIINYPITDYDKYKIHSLVDISLWLKLLRKGTMIYIAEPLSNFRIHNSQNTYNEILGFWASIDFFKLIISSYENKVFIKSRKELLESILAWYKEYSGDLIKFSNYYNDRNDDNPEILELRDEYKNCFTKFQNILLE
ncbi:glycosyltransferase [Clostridium estertheticum]|uniref:glycosyltransferase n=1 Tax=Clostridium estertheticum TaxID=238834 RepID=UPI001CF27F61|nr:glycosyltransferase [Clostridium estertheticum]MCB2356978.1 glycosyltransferase [Clostridium estertheticum]WAG42224.1 glycosyltransferase [Clostridium estertheticum]